MTFRQDSANFTIRFLDIINGGNTSKSFIKQSLIGMEPPKKKLSVRSRYKTFRLGFEGMGNLIECEPNAWFDIAAAIVVVIAGVEFGLTSTEWIFVVFAIGFVLTTVAASISIDFLASAPDVVDVPLIDVAKSLAAASVLIANFTAFIVGLIVFIPKLFMSA